MTSKRRKLALSAILLVPVLFLFAYRLIFYEPPLLDAGRRNIADKTIDFLWCGWYMTKGSFIKDYLKDQGTAYENFFKAGWYREKLLLKVFRITKEDLTVFLESRRDLDRRSIEKQLYQFAMSRPEEQAAQLSPAGRPGSNR